MSFPPGDYTVKREVGEKLIGQGKAEEIEPPKKPNAGD